MAQVRPAQIHKRPGSSSLRGPALVRLLARLGGSVAAEPKGALADRLSQWLGWVDAITLSTVLTNAPPAVPAGKAGGADDMRIECDRLRAGLLAAIAGDGKPAAGREPDRRLRAQAAIPAGDVDYTAYRQRYVSLQQAMESDIGRLRARLRSALAARSPEMTRLSMVDALMERTLAPRERSLLDAIPGMLERHFEHLRPGEAQDAPASGDWLETFRRDMHSVLRAELAVRLQPIDGLLAALCQAREQAEPGLKQ